MNQVRTKLIRSAVVGLIVVGASLALARVHPFGDAGLYSATSAETPMLNDSQVPAEVRAILSDKCANCHSNQPNAPVYGHFAPVSWLMERDIVNARKAMNLSLWNSYPADLQQTLAAKIVQETKSHQMPPAQYRLIHWNARIGDGDLSIFDRWAHELQAKQADATVASDTAPEPGRALFEKRCSGCHALTQNREGPRLQGVYGRTSGRADGFAYSAALKNAHIVWDETSLDKWLTNPDAFIPGNEMDFLVSKPRERRDLISYLKQSSGK